MKKRPSRKNNDREHQEQKSVISWANLQTAIAPELELLFAIPNGGDRHLFVAKKLKAEGAKKGVPDLCLPVARGRYHGLYIEMKKPANRITGDRPGTLSKDQQNWIQRLTGEGYRAVVCYGAQAAINEISNYLKL